MLKYLMAAATLSLFPFLAMAQLWPKEGDVLNYRIIGFSFPPVKLPPNSNCRVEIATGDYHDTTLFKKNITAVHYLHTNRAIIEVPEFGSDYTWRVIYSDKSFNAAYSSLHHFSTRIPRYLKDHGFQVKVHRPAITYKDALVFIDGTNAIYNMKGEPVWYLPRKVVPAGFGSGVEDMKLSPFGTITMLVDHEAYEIDYEGNILWKAPVSGFHKDTVRHYHHQFSRLQNGNYMVLDETEWTPPMQALHKQDNMGAKWNLLFDILIEYNKNGDVVWSWNSQDFYKDKWEKYADDPTNLYSDAHANAFAFDEARKYIYLSFKNTSQILKINYPEGTVVKTFGIKDIMDPADTVYVPFCMQHACKVTEKGLLYMFNNNVNDRNAILMVHSMKKDQMPSYEPKKPRVMLFEETKKNPGLKKLWDFECPVNDDSLVNDARRAFLKFKLTIGGNVMELNNGAFFVSVCTPYNTLFIVNRAKRLMWKATIDINTSSGKMNMPFSPYRASIITGKKEIEGLIWHNAR